MSTYSFSNDYESDKTEGDDFITSVPTGNGFFRNSETY